MVKGMYEVTFIGAMGGLWLYRCGTCGATIDFDAITLHGNWHNPLPEGLVTSGSAVER